LRLSIEKIEQQNVDGISPRCRCEIGEDVGWHWRQLHFAGSHTIVLLEGSDGLRVAIFGDVKVFFAQTQNGLPLFVGYNHVHDNDAAFSSDRRNRNRRGNRRLLLLGIRETEPRKKKQRNGRE
jgi:hypothetical protein